MAEPSGIEKSPISKPSSEPLQMEIDHLSAAQMPEISQYEQSRELRIRENLERMQKLGILDLSLKLKSSAPSKQNRRKSVNPKASPPSFDLPPAGPLRRSSRFSPNPESLFLSSYRNWQCSFSDIFIQIGILVVFALFDCLSSVFVQFSLSFPLSFF